MYRQFGKRVLDVTISIFALSILAPIIGLIALLVRMHLGRAVIFRQMRPGHNGKLFTLYKFRTMTDSRDSNGHLMIDAERLTPFGGFLRTTSLDELPELFNVLRGEMSLVGPRPLLTRYTPFFTNAEQLRFSVRPGITGLAQISGRNNLSWDMRMARDLEYVRRCSFLLDLLIIAITFWRVLMCKGLRVDPGASMPDLDEERRREKESFSNNPT